MYDDFANVYDELMDNVPYVKWAEMLNDIIREEGISIPNSESQDNLESERNLVVDLACGTGTLTELM
nr:class I SAM-dependent methyltransferase [Lachnospiraceae bacterium]